MGKPKKPKTPEYERLQAQVASSMFGEGTNIKNGSAAESMGDRRYDPSGKQESAARGAAAVRNKENLIASRKNNNVDYAADTYDQQFVQGIAAAGQGGKDTSGMSREIARGNSQISHIGAIMSKQDSDKTINKMMDRATKQQGILDVVTAAGSMYANSTVNKAGGKVNDAAMKRSMDGKAPQSMQEMATEATGGDQYAVQDADQFGLTKNQRPKQFNYSRGIGG